MDRLAHVVLMLCAVELGNDHRRAGGKAGKKAHQQVDQRGGRAAYGRKRLFAHKISHHDGVRRIIELLKKGAEQDGEKESEKLLPDDPFRDLIDVCFRAGSFSAELHFPDSHGRPPFF